MRVCAWENPEHSVEGPFVGCLVAELLEARGIAKSGIAVGEFGKDRNWQIRLEVRKLGRRFIDGRILLVGIGCRHELDPEQSPVSCIDVTCGQRNRHPEVLR